MTDRSVRVTLSAQVQGYVEGMQKAAQATREAGSETEKLGQQQAAFEQMGRAAMVSGGLMVAGLVGATKAAMDWNTAWAGVTKTVDGSPDQLAEVERGLRDLSGVLPASHTEIAAVAEAAGQLGIQTPNVVEFTRTMIDLGETTNLSAEEAATSLARFMNVMGTSQGEVSNLGAALVDLGNNYATTEAEILEMAQRLSGAGVQIGMSEGQVLGLSTALSSVGIEAEAGGSAMSKVMIDIAASVDSGGERLEQFAEVAGVSAATFAEQWRKDPGAALAVFVQGLANAEAQGKSTFGVLEELGITEVRMRDALLRSSAAADQFSEAMQKGNEAFAENNALSEEAEKRYQTTASKLDTMTNKLTDAAIEIGEKLLPVVEAGADALGDFADNVSGLPEPLQWVATYAGAAGGAALLAGGSFLLAVPKIAEYRVALELLGDRALKAHDVLVGLGKGAVVAGVVYAAVQATDQFQEWIREISGARVEAAALAEEIRSTGDAAGGVTQSLNAGAIQLFIDDTDQAVQHLKALQSASGNAWADFQNTWLGTITGGPFSGNALGLVKENIAELDKALAELVSSGNAREAAAGYEKFAELAKQAGYDSAETAQQLPLYAEAAHEAGVKVGASGDAASDAADAYLEQADAASAAAGEMSKLIDTANEFNAVGQSAEQANARFRESLEQVNVAIRKAKEGQEGYSLSLDASTAAGAENRAMLAGLAGESQTAAEKLFEQEIATDDAGTAMDNYRQRLQEGRDELIRVLDQFGVNGEAAQAYADEIYRIPTDHEFEAIAQTAQAKQDVEDYDAAARAITEEQKTTVSAETKAAESAIARIKTAIGGIERWVNIHFSTTGGSTGGGKVTDGGGGGFGGGRADGGINDYQRMMVFANGGGVETGVYSGGKPIIKFAEPETGWEAFISGKPSARDRNRQIWQETGERLGIMREIREALGGAGSSTPVSVTQVINPRPGMSESEVGRIAASRISDEVGRLL